MQLALSLRNKRPLKLMLFDPGKGISFGDKNHPSRRINFIFIFGLIRQGAFGALRLL
jgi:hypothetical protein